jgi:hypothetical protein
MSQQTINQIVGMNTFNSFINADGVAVPSRITDAVPHESGRVISRDVPTQVIALTSASNLWKSKGTGLTYCIDEGYLCVVNWNTSTVTILMEITHPESRVFYENFGTIDFIGNEFWHTAVENGAVREWGASIDVLNSMDWQTTPNGLVLYRGDDVIPHPSDFAHKPNLMKGFKIAHGRLWGYYGRRLIYSEPLAYEWFVDDENHFDFDTNVTMYAPVSGGAFVGTVNETYFLSPTGDAQVVKDYNGVQENSLLYAPKIKDMPKDTPCWLDENGFVVAGMPDGQLVQITKERIKTTPHGTCRAGVIMQDNIQTLLFRIGE